MNRKGVSQVVVTTLLILVAIAAVIIVWKVVMPMIERAGEGDLALDCIELELSVVEAGCSSTGVVTVSRGADNADLTGVKLIFYNVDKETLSDYTVDKTEVPGALGTKIYSGLNVPDANYVNIAGLLGEQGYVCDLALSEPQLC